MRAAPSAANPTAGSWLEPHQREAAVALQRLEQVEREVAGDAVDVADAAVPQPIEEELVQRHAAETILAVDIIERPRESPVYGLRSTVYSPAGCWPALPPSSALHRCRPRPDDVPTVLVSRQVAEEQGITVGALVQVAPPDGSRARQFRVAGIYEPTPDPGRLGATIREVRLHLPDLLDLAREDGAVVGTDHVRGREHHAWPIPPTRPPSPAT